MIFYLVDSQNDAILFISDDIFLVNNIKSGILDCERRVLNNDSYFISEQIKNYINSSNDTIGIKLVSNQIVEFSLKEFPFTIKKKELAQIRKIAFEELLFGARSSRAKNIYGFNLGDEFYIKNALNNNLALEEYASIMKIDTEFAKQELSLIVDSIFLDNFRIFTVSNMLKEKINKCVTREEIEKILPIIKNSFWMAGVADV
jgi:hypothetical protein